MEGNREIAEKLGRKEGRNFKMVDKCLYAAGYDTLERKKQMIRTEQK